MKYGKLADGAQIEVGDRIKSDGAFGSKIYAVARVTKHFAFVKFNDIADGKFPRIYNDFSFCPAPKQRFRTTTYSAWRAKP